MSLQHQRRLRCLCGHEQEVTLYGSVNVTLEPALKDELLRGELNAMTCDGCGQTSRVPVPLLYHDMARKLMVNLVADAAEGRSLAEALRASSTSCPGYTLRIVATLDELLDKVAVFDAGLDDRLVEVVKLLARAKQDPGPGFGPFWFLGIVGAEGDRKLAFRLRGPDRTVRAEVDYGLYDHARDRWSAALTEPEDHVVGPRQALALLRSSPS
jgi:hypothetical protein